MYITSDYTMASFNMPLNDDIIDCFTEKKNDTVVDSLTEKKVVIPKKNIESFKSDSIESYHKEDILKINQQKLITHVNEHSKIIEYYNYKLKNNKKG